jgi:hypothetical protein
MYMTILSKAHWLTDKDSVTLSMPIAKVDKERRIVSGFATLDNVDKQYDIVPSDTSVKAFETFRGNLREMHMPIAVGKVVSFKVDKFYDKEEDKFYNGVYVDAYVSKGAQDTWEKILDGTLTGFSIGGNIKDSEKMYREDMDKEIRVIKEYELHELSLVDNPANQFANILSIEKMDNGQNKIDGYLTKTSFENVYFCSDDNLIRVSSIDDSPCPSCEKTMNNIGFVETNDVDKSITIKNLLKSYTNDDTIESEDLEKKNKYKESMHHEDEDMDKAKNIRVGDMVSWNSSGGTARGKVTRVVRNGKIKVPNSSFTINGTSDDPALAIRIYPR